MPSRPTADAVAVRPATRADVEAVTSLLEDAFADKYRPAYGGLAHAAIAAVMRAELDADAGGYLVATCGDAVVGAAHVTTRADEGAVDWAGTLRRSIGRLRAMRAGVVLTTLTHGPLAPGEAYVGEVAVDSAWRRRGVATALMDAVEAEARRRGCALLSLWVTWENDAARRLYEARGFREVRRRRIPAGRRMFGARGLALLHLRLSPE